MFVIVWEFRIRAERRAEFERHYGPHGAWAELFRVNSAYRGTSLLRDIKEPGRYLTVDRWETAEAYAAFHAANAARYAEIDRACEALTSSERKLGAYISIEA
jgi:heme-degrading monooxygenase HmoA